MRFALLIILVNAAFCQLKGQACEGKVTTPQGNVLIGAIVKVFSNNILNQYKITNYEGLFTIQFANTKTDSVSIEISFLGYATKTLTKANINCGMLNNIILQEESHQLEAITLKAARALTVLGDTTRFSVGYFKQNTDRTLEQLLQRLPGVSIKNGTAYYNGQAIQKMLLEGDDVTGRIYENLLANLGIEGVQSIDVIKNYVNKNSISDVFNDSKQLVMNVRFKKNYLGKLSGDLNAGVTQNFKNYTAEIRSLLLAKKVKTVNSIHSNNLGKTSFFEPSVQIPENDITEFVNKLPIQANAQQVLLFDNDFSNGNTLPTERLTFNYSNHFATNTLFKHNANASTKLKIVAASNNGMQYKEQQLWALISGLLTPLNSQQQRQTLQQNLVTGNLHTSIKLTTNKQLELYTQTSFVTGNNEVNSVVEKDTTVKFANSYKSRHTTFLVKYSGSNTAKTWLFTTQLSGSTANQYIQTTLNPAVVLQTATTDTLAKNFNQNIQFKTKAFTLNTSLVYKPSKAFTLTAVLGFINNYQLIQSEGFTDTSSGKFVYKLGTDNNFLQTVLPYGTIISKWNAKRNITIELGNQVLFNLQKSRQKYQSTPLWLPNLSLMKKIRSQVTILITATRSLTNSNATNLLSNGRLTGIQNLQLGVNSFYQTLQTNGQIAFYFMGSRLRWAGYVNTGHSNIQNGVVSNFTATPLTTILKDSLLQNNTYFSFANAEIQHNWNNFKNKVSFQIRVANGNNNFLINNRIATRAFRQLQLNPTFSWRISKSIRTNSAYQISLLTQLAANGIPNIPSYQQLISHETEIQVLKTMFCTLHYNHFFTSQQGERANIPFLDIGVSLANKKGTLQYQAQWKNVLNKNSFVLQSNGAFLTTTSITRLQPSWLLISLLVQLK